MAKHDALKENLYNFYTANNNVINLYFTKIILLIIYLFLLSDEANYRHSQFYP